MNMNNKVVIGTIVAVVAIVAVFLLIKSSSLYAPSKTQTTVQTSQESPVPTTQQATSPTQAQQGQNTITYTSSGFSPASLTIKAGTTVTWINNSGSGLSVNSNPHPIHTSYSPLNIGTIVNGQSKSLIFDKPGTYGYHNHLNPSDKGTVIVQ